MYFMYLFPWRKQIRASSASAAPASDSEPEMEHVVVDKMQVVRTHSC